MTSNAISKWSIDPTHSEIGFKIRHLMISSVSGKFNKFDADIKSDELFKQPKITFTIDSNSIDTGNEQRDGHLQSDDFFNSATYPHIKFELGEVESKGTGLFIYHGILTIRNISKSVQFDVTYNGSMVDPYGQHKAGFEVEGKINRKEFDLKWDATTETGGIVVSDEVRIHANIQVIKQA